MHMYYSQNLNLEKEVKTIYMHFLGRMMFVVQTVQPPLVTIGNCKSKKFISKTFWCDKKIFKVKLHP